MGNYVSSSLVVKNETVAGSNTANRVGGVLESLARNSIIVDNYSQLRAIDNSVAGDIVYVKGANSAYDGGHGFFRRVEAGEIVMGTSVSTGGGTQYVTLDNNDYPGDLIDNTLAIWSYRTNPTRFRFTTGATLKNSRYREAGRTSTVLITKDANYSVPVGTSGFVLPEGNEGWRVIPTFGSYSNDFYWERIVDDGKMTPEMFGGKHSTVGESNPADATDAIQTLMDSPFNAHLPGHYYISSVIQVSFSKGIYGNNGGRVLDSFRYPTNYATHEVSTVWTDVNSTNFFNIRVRVNIHDLEFNTEFATAYTGTVINYDISHKHIGQVIHHCSFIGSSNIGNTAGIGGIAIRGNSDDADNTVAQYDGSLIGQGQFYNTRVESCLVQYFHTAYRIDPAQNGTVLGADGVHYISTNANTNYSEMTTFFVKMAYDWQTGSVNTIKGEYLQDGPILAFGEKDLPLVRVYGQTFISVTTGDVEFASDPATSESASAYTYPRQHVYSNLHDTGLSVVLVENAGRGAGGGSFNSDWLIGTKSPDGTWYRISRPSNGGGTISWV